MKRLLDVTAAVIGLLALSPVLAITLFLIWRQDRHSPLYVSTRIGRHGRPFRMLKLRSMVVDAATTGVSSTAADDSRITPVGRFVRASKLDEVAQLWNVLKGDMSLVGPRPNVAEGGTNLYTRAERALLSVRPGITDFASIVFADEGEILAGASDPDLTYNRIVRPGKSRLGLLYVNNHTLLADLALIALTALVVVAPRTGRRWLLVLMRGMGAPEDLMRLAGRTIPLSSMPPPGGDVVVYRTGPGKDDLSCQVPSGTGSQDAHTPWAN